MKKDDNRVEIWPIPEGEERLTAPVSLFIGCTGSTKATGFRTLGDVFRLMRDPANIRLVDMTRQLQTLKVTSTKDYEALKQGHCPAFISGKFPRRVNNACTLYVPLLGFDIDSVLSEDELLRLFQRCQVCPFVFAAFLSPSHKGLRILIWCGSELESHEAYYGALTEYLSDQLEVPVKSALKQQWRDEGIDGDHINTLLKQTTHLDSVTSNLARLWFYCHIPEEWFHLNVDSKVFILDPVPPAIPSQLPAPPENPVHAKGYKHVFSHAEKVGNLVDQIVARRVDITSGYENWFKIGCSLACEFGESGRSFFHQVSQFHPDYDYRENDEEYDRCMAKFALGTITIGSFYMFAKDKGFFIDFEALKAQYPDVFNCTAPTDGIHPPKPDCFFPILQCRDLEMPDHIELDEELAPANLKIRDGCYTWDSQSSKGEKTTSEISNFVVIPLYLLKHHRHPKRIWFLINCFGEPATVCISVQDMATSNKLIAEIEGKGNFILNWTAKQFAALKRVLYHAEKEAEEISMLGYQPDSGLFAFCNGVFDGQTFFQINSFGIIETPKGTFYIPALSSVNKNDRSEYIHERKFRYLNTPTPLIQWADLMCRAYGHNGRIGICYLIAALFRDIVFDYLDCFPILFLFGPPKTGKSTFRESLLSLFGIPQPAISLGSSSSPKGFARKLGQFANALICFEEYKNTIKRPLIEMLKSMYDGIGYERAQTTNDNKTHSSPVTSACIVAGQEMPTKENALFSRVFILEFGTTSREDKRDFELLKEKQDEGLGNTLLQILQHRNRVEQQFKPTYNRVYEELKQDNSLRQISDRSLKNVAAILAPYRIIADRESFPFSYDEVRKLCIHQLLEQDRIMERTNEVSTFWQLFEYLTIEKYIHADTHFRLDREQGDLFVSLSRIYALYRDHGERQGLQILDKETLVRYLKLHPSFIAQPGNRDQKKVRMGNDGASLWAYQFRFSELKPFFETENF